MRIFQNITTFVIYSFFSKPKAISRAAEASILLSCSLVTVVVNRIGVSLILPRVELSILYQDEVQSEVLATSLDKKKDSENELLVLLINYENA